MNNDESKSHLQSIIDKNSSDTNREDYNKVKYSFVIFD